MVMFLIDDYYEGTDYVIYNYDLDSEYYLEHPEYFVEYLEDFRAARNYEMVQVIEEYLKNNNELEQ
jgi:urocanate hydratase